MPVPNPRLDQIESMLAQVQADLMAVTRTLNQLQGEVTGLTEAIKQRGNNHTEDSIEKIKNGLEKFFAHYETCLQLVGEDLFVDEPTSRSGAV